jgi:hypothetical protein
VRGQRHAPAALHPPGKTRYPLYGRLGGPQGRTGQVRKISPPPGFDPWTVQPVASRYTDYANRSTHRMSGRAKNDWKWENNDHVHLQTPLRPSAAKKFHTSKKQCSHDAGVTTTQYIYSTTIYTCQHAESAKQCQLLSPFPTDISSHEDQTFRANTSS